MATLLQDTDAGELSSALKTISDWYRLGLFLGLPKYDLNNIEKDYQDSKRRMLEMVDRWLRSTPTASWEDVVNALQQMGENRVAENIRQKYIKEGSKCACKSPLSDQGC